MPSARGFFRRLNFQNTARYVRKSSARARFTSVRKFGGHGYRFFIKPIDFFRGIEYNVVKRGKRASVEAIPFSGRAVG